MFAKKSKKEQVIAYLHTHWDREWYQPYEVFRLRLLRVFDNILELLELGSIPSFYFDGQVAALLDYLEMRPEKEQLVRNLIAEKKLFIGPFYCLVDEFLTDGICFRKNLEIGLKTAREFGCTDFIGYLADTFGHSKNVPLILKEFGIDKAIVWRGCGELPSEFIFNGVNTVNLIRGYFNDIFATDKTIEQKAEFIKSNLDKIAAKSGDVLLMPIGADHLDIPCDIFYQIEDVNNLLEDYEIKLSNPFEYFEKVNFKVKHNDELRDNSTTFILQGSYSARLDLKRLNTIASYKLDLADKLQYNFGEKYKNVIEYAYKLLLQNQAHDSICGCSIDAVHAENITRYNKILQICDGIYNEIRLGVQEGLSMSFKNSNKYKLLTFETDKIEDGAQVLSKRKGFAPELLADTFKIPVTEDYTTIYTLLKEFNPPEKKKNEPDLAVDLKNIFNSNIRLEISKGQLNLYDKAKIYPNFIEFIRCKDAGDSYNFAPVSGDEPETAYIKSAKIISDGPLQAQLRVVTSFFNVDIILNKKSKLMNFRIKWLNLLTNKRWQVRFNLNKPVKEVFSEDMNLLISRKFDPNYKITDNLPKERGKEARTNTAPMQRFCWANGLGVITKGLTEYEADGNSLCVTLLRSTGIISNPKNPARTTPAGPPVETPAGQLLGENIAEFSIGFFPVKDWADMVEEVYPQTVLF